VPREHHEDAYIEGTQIAMLYCGSSRITPSLVRSTRLPNEKPSRRSPLPGRSILLPGSRPGEDGVLWLPTKDPRAETSGQHGPTSLAGSGHHLFHLGSSLASWASEDAANCLLLHIQPLACVVPMSY
jgi:hypothetical protein